MSLAELFKKLENHFNSLVVKNEQLLEEIKMLKEDKSRIQGQNNALKTEIAGIKKYHSHLVAINEESLRNLKNIDSRLGDKDASEEN